MSVSVTDLSTLDQTKVDQFEEELIQQLQELEPLADVDGGAFQSLVLHLKAILDAATQENIDLVSTANSLLEVTANPTLADNDTVDKLLSNYNLTRNPGSAASGAVTIVLSQLIGTVISVDSEFTINGLTFVTPVTYGVRTSEDAILTDNDVLITQTGTDQYSFTITLNAQEVGSAGNVLRGLSVTPTDPITAFSKAYVQTDFTGGIDPSTNEELLTQLASGMAIAAWSNRVSIESLILKQSDFANVKSMSIIGFGDNEMQRDQHSIWPGSLGGRSDIYIKSQPMYRTVAITKSATLVSKVGPIGVWQFGLGRDDAPGFYKVDRILLTRQDPTDIGFQAEVDIRAYDLTDVVGPPDIVNPKEAVFSRYQTSVIQFVDNITDASSGTVGTTQNDYVVVIRQMPLIAEIQDFLLGRTVRPTMGDVLVKAPIPCFTSLAFTVNYKNGTTAPEVSDIQNDVSSAVNGLGFVGQLSSSFIDKVLHTAVSNLVSVTNMLLTADILQPDGSSIVFSDSAAISIPDSPALMESGRTAIFFARPEDISVTLVAVDVPNV